MDQILCFLYFTKHFWLTLVISLISLILIRLFFIMGNLLSLKIIKEPICLYEYNLFNSLIMLVLYFRALSITANARFMDLNNLEWYLVYIIVGFSSVLWCYFDWNLTITARPRLNIPPNNALKRGMVFVFVLFFSLFFGYKQITNLMGSTKIGNEYFIANVSIISSIIAADRLLSQIYFIFKSEE